MKRAIVAAVLMLGLTPPRTATEVNGEHVVLPNPRLLRCTSAECFQLWSEKPIQSAVFPKQLIVDMNQGCIYGMTALYDKSVSVDAIKSAIDERYAKWQNTELSSSPVKLWRVEPEQFTIQLSVASGGDEKRKVAEAGTKQTIYIAFGGKSTCNFP